MDFFFRLWKSEEIIPLSVFFKFDTDLSFENLGFFNNFPLPSPLLSSSEEQEEDEESTIRRMQFFPKIK